MIKVLHALEHSVPKLAGYTIRSKYIVDNQKKAGLEPVVITSPLQEKTDRSLLDFEIIDGIRYYRTGIYNKLDFDQSLPVRLCRRYQYAAAYKDAIKKICEIEKPDIIQAHSSYLNGNRANKVGRLKNLPTIYEVRGLWGDTAVANGKIGPHSWKYKFINYMDLNAIREANGAVVISNLLKEDLIEKGISPEKITIVPNGIDTALFVMQEKNHQLIEKYRLQDKLVLGFIGSVRKIEGLELLIKILPRLLKNRNEIRVLIVGGGEEVSELKKLCKELGVIDKVIFSGQVPHEDILKYYALIDIFIYPRIDSKVNQRVTPLKPLEAMAMEKVVIASDVGGLAELIKNNDTGLLFKVGNGDDLLAKTRKLIDTPSFMEGLCENARKWVVEERSWEKVIRIYLDLYQKMLSGL